MTIATDTRRFPAFTLGDRLRKARELAGEDRQDFARRVGIHRDSLTKYETGRQIPRRPVIVTWAMATGVDADWLEHGFVPMVDAPKLPDLDSNQEPIVIGADGTPRRVRRSEDKAA